MGPFKKPSKTLTITWNATDMINEITTDNMEFLMTTSKMCIDVINMFKVIAASKILATKLKYI